MKNTVGIVNIDDEVHDQIRKASSVSCRAINAQAAFWIKIGMLCEMNPTLSFSDIVSHSQQGSGLTFGHGVFHKNVESVSKCQT